jgi:hypothetical protein
MNDEVSRAIPKNAFFVLSGEEIAAFTGKTQRAQRRYGSQATVLLALGGPFMSRPDKTLIVYRAHVDASQAINTAAHEEPRVMLPVRMRTPSRGRRRKSV